MVLLRLRTALVRLRRGRAARTPIAALGPGPASVEGRVAGSADLLAPISGRAAIGYRLLIERETGVRGWVAVVERSEFGDFELCDSSGVIRVRASCSTTELEVAERGGEGGPFRPLPAEVVRLIAARMPVQGVLFHKGFRWREWVLEPDREVRVRGSVVSVASEAEPVGYREFGRALVLGGGAGAPLEIRD